MSTKKDGEQKEKTGLLQLQYKTLKRITYLGSKPSITDKEVYEVTQEFFKELLELDYMCTHDEVIEELQHVYIDKQLRSEVELFLKHIGTMEYSTREFDQQELRDLLGELKIMLRQLIHHNRKKKSIFSKFFAKKEVDEETEEKKAFAKLEEDIKIEEAQEEKKTAQQLMREIPLILHTPDKETATKLYFEANQHYEQLTLDDQKQVYEKLMHAYEHVRGL